MDDDLEHPAARRLTSNVFSRVMPYAFHDGSQFFGSLPSLSEFELTTSTPPKLTFDTRKSDWTPGRGGSPRLSILRRLNGLSCFNTCLAKAMRGGGGIKD